VFDETLAERAREAFGIDECFSAVQAATPAFVDAATDPLALRSFRLDGARYSGLRYTATRSIDVEEMNRWRSEGVRVVATRHLRGPVRSTAPAAAALGPGDSAILAGPEEVIQGLATSRV
jgi:hypothetical protein